MVRGPEDAIEPKRRLQRHQPQPSAGGPRRRVQLGTGYPHRGPAPAYPERQLTYQPSAKGGERRPGRLRVLNVPADRDGAGRHTAMPTVAVAVCGPGCAASLTIGPR